MAKKPKKADAKPAVLTSKDKKTLSALRELGLLQDVAAGARAERLARVLRVLPHREDRYREGRMGHEALRQRREARASGHGQIERQQVGLVLAHFADHRRHVRGFGHDPKLPRLALQDGTDAVADHGVVVGDDHVDRSGRSWRAALHTALHTGKP